MLLLIGIEGSDPALSSPAQTNVLVSHLCVSLGSKVCFQQGLHHGRIVASWLFRTLGKNPSGLLHERPVLKANVFCVRSHLRLQ